jgi:hypothetical protein
VPPGGLLNTVDEPARGEFLPSGEAADSIACGEPHEGRELADAWARAVEGLRIIRLGLDEIQL